ncbi:MAG: YbaB/EbfC family nucleoid-associated protein [Chloroflexota bacterium]|nr:YbaB/EbfC family nucleoid-associated protein [Chloroflexota bacterium]MDP6509477.1 YbaB/EbfC family nucleoid-associated protein [Chloroflexota bacterium]MDP6757245.1 YbaB/EbfC family nucleoid-associated protein [Chloroflexota bacterium]
MEAAMQMMRKMQKQMEKIQAELAEQTLEVSSGGGVVTVTITGDQKIRAIKVDPEAVDPEDVEMLEDLVAAAVNEALAESQALAGEKLGALTGGLKIPGLT